MYKNTDEIFDALTCMTKRDGDIYNAVSQFIADNHGSLDAASGIWYFQWRDSVLPTTQAITGQGCEGEEESLYLPDVGDLMLQTIRPILRRECTKLHYVAQCDDLDQWINGMDFDRVIPHEEEEAAGYIEDLLVGDPDLIESTLFNIAMDHNNLMDIEVRHLLEHKMISTETVKGTPFEYLAYQVAE